jgi:hypothetical protein
MLAIASYTCARISIAGLGTASAFSRKGEECLHSGGMTCLALVALAWVLRGVFVEWIG